MKITIQNLTKRFANDWIVRDFSYSLDTYSKTAIIGPNGSGKSTLLKLIAGTLPPTKGKIEFWLRECKIDPDLWHTHLSFCSPAQKLIEELSLTEFLQFHFKFKNILGHHSIPDLIDLAYFNDAEKKLIKNFSSGMKQRLKLLVALFSDSEVVLLDEPTTNLDEKGIHWYERNIINYTKNRLVVISSNQPNEYKFCSNIIDLGKINQYQKNN